MIGRRAIFFGMLSAVFACAEAPAKNAKGADENVPLAFTPRGCGLIKLTENSGEYVRRALNKRDFCDVCNAAKLAAP
jgi:hypothetical protein